MIDSHDLSIDFDVNSDKENNKESYEQQLLL